MARCAIRLSTSQYSPKQNGLCRWPWNILADHPRDLLSREEPFICVQFLVPQVFVDDVLEATCCLRVRNFEVWLQLCSYFFFDFQFGNRSPSHCFNTTTCTWGYFTMELHSPSPEVTRIRSGFELTCLLEVVYLTNRAGSSTWASKPSGISCGFPWHGNSWDGQASGRLLLQTNSAPFLLSRWLPQFQFLHFQYQQIPRSSSPARNMYFVKQLWR